MFDKLTGTKQRDIIIIPEIKYQNITIGNDKVLGHFQKQILINPKKSMTNPAA